MYRLINKMICKGWQMFIFVSIIAIPAPATEIEVPTDYTTIQEAIDSASHGDTVMVLPGTYIENINFSGKNITLSSQAGPELTVIDGGQPTDPEKASTVTFESNENRSCTLTGFTITNGSGTKSSSNYYGGGIYCSSCTPTIQGNVITRNPCKYGMGIYCNNASPAIIDNRISEHVRQDFGGAGGGIYAKYGSSPLIKNNVIEDNHMMESGQGGGLIFWYSCYPMIEGNIIRRNMASEGIGVYCGEDSSMLLRDNIICDNMHNSNNGDGGGVRISGETGSVIINNKVCNNSVLRMGGGIYCHYSNPSFIVGNEISGNSANYGGGLYVSSDSEPLLASNLICNNTGYVSGGGCYFHRLNYQDFYNNTIMGNHSPGPGPGICMTSDCHVTLTNCIIRENLPATSADIAVAEGYYGPSSLHIQYCNIEDGQAGISVDATSTLTWGDGMIETDPEFVDAANDDYHLRYTSPCRNAGTTMFGMPAFDMDNTKRIAEGNVDIGADEFYTHFYITGNTSPGSEIQAKWTGLPGTSPVGLLLGSALIDPPLPTTWGDFHLAAPWILIPLPHIPADGVLTLSEAIPMSPPAPYDVHIQALIGLTPEALTNPYILQVR